MKRRTSSRETTFSGNHLGTYKEEEENLYKKGELLSGPTAQKNYLQIILINSLRKTRQRTE